ncbi:hypothetical protein [Methanobacterium sp.]
MLITFDFLTAWLANIYYILLIAVPVFLVFNAFKLIIRAINAKNNSK